MIEKEEAINQYKEKINQIIDSNLSVNKAMKEQFNQSLNQKNEEIAQLKYSFQKEKQQLKTDTESLQSDLENHKIRLNIALET